MPTPVSTARQCLTEEAARALDEAVAVARRRSHAQTTSLHAVSSLLALPSSTLRDACARARSSAYSPRLQFRALELSVSVSLDRLPSGKASDEPPVSNSLMAAIKRSQANQRRQPETFQFYQQLHQQNQSSLTCVKVELKHFILSILDDPIVSRVFGEAGFRSCDIKLVVLHPPSVSRFSRSRCPPLFLCNLTESESNHHRSINFPFAGFSGFEHGDENCKRIEEVLVNRKGKNPLLIGVCAKDALSSFTEYVQKGKNGVLTEEIDGLRLVCIEKEICEFVNQGGSKEMMGIKFEELGKMVEDSGSGVVVNYGELKVFDDEEDDDGKSGESASYVVSQLSSLLEVENGRFWLIGAAASYETYMKFLARFPAIEKDWDLHLLPITSSSASTGGLYSKSSLMGSFVPLGGFFSAPSEFKNLSSSTNQSLTRCDLCNEKYEHEVSVVMKGGSTTSVADQYSASLASWLQIDKGDTSKRMDMMKTKDDGSVLSAKLMSVQKKWNDICQRLHCARPFQPAISRLRSQVPGVQGFQLVVDGKESSNKESSLEESGSKISFKPTELPKISPPKPNSIISGISEAENAYLPPNLPVEVSKCQQLELESPLPSSSLLRSLNQRTSQSSVTSVATELGLGTLYVSAAEKLRESRIQDHKGKPHYLPASVPAEFDGVSDNVLSHNNQSSTCSDIGLRGNLLDPKDFKSLWRALAEKVSGQDEAVHTISQIVSRCRTGHGRRHGSNQKRDIWLSFVGPDKVGKRKIATALAETIFGNKESLVNVNLSSEHGISQSKSIFDRQDLSSYDVKFRRKTVVDYIAEEMSKKPHSVVLLENVDEADFLVQTSLSQAIRTGKFPDSHGREMGIYNMIFVTTSRTKKVKQDVLSWSIRAKFSEERILQAKGWQMQISVACIAGNANRTDHTNVMVMPHRVSNPVSAGKRKQIDTSDSTKQDNILQIAKRAHKASCLDLNLPVEEMEEENDYENYNSDSASENSEAWLDDFFEQLDEKVIFKPFDFDALATEVLNKISRSFQKTVGREALLEIDEEVLVQMLAAAWLSDRKKSVDVWINEVLNTSFAQARQRYRLTGHCVVKLVACEGLLMEEQAHGVCLPVRVNLK